MQLFQLKAKNIYIFVLGRWFKLKYVTLSLHHIVPGVINFVIC